MRPTAKLLACYIAATGLGVLLSVSLSSQQDGSDSSAVQAQLKPPGPPAVLAANQDHTDQAQGEPQRPQKLVVRILALFSGAPNDLGLDHRLGRQVLKLAASRARRLAPEVSDIQLIIYNDSSECKSNANDIISRVAEQFYINEVQVDETCDLAHKIQGSDFLQDQPGCGNPTVSSATTNDSRLAQGRHLAEIGRIDAILGPSCDHLIDSVARMAAYWRTPIYTVTSISGTFGRKDVYPTLTRLSPSIDHLSMFIMKVMERFKWRHLAIVVDQEQAENLAIFSNLERTIDRMRYTLPVARKIFSFSSFVLNDTQANGTLESAPNGNSHSEFSQELPLTGLSHCTQESRELLLGVRRVARVVLMLLNEPQVVRRLLLCAHELRFNNGEYTFLALNLGLKSSEATKRAAAAEDQQQQHQQQQQASGNGKQSYDWFVEGDEANNLKARQMFESLMVFSVELPASNEYNIFVEQTLDMAHQEYPGAHFEHSSVGLLAVALHDSLLLAVEAQRRQFIAGNANNSESYRTRSSRRNMSTVDHEYLDDFDEGDEGAQQQQQSGSSRREGHRVPLMWNERYPFGLITGMHINANGDQELDYVLSDMEPELGLFRPVASYSKDARQIQMLPASYIHWPARVNAITQQVLHNDEPPPDEPECGFTGDAQHCIDRQNLFTALAIFATFLLCLLLIAAISFRRYRKIKYQMQLDDYWWQINWADLEFLRVQRNSLTSNLASSLVRQLRTEGGAGSVVGGLGRQSIVGSAVSSGKRSHASSHESHKNAGTFGPAATTAPELANIGKRRSAVSLIVTPATVGQGCQGETVGSEHASQTTHLRAKSSVGDEHSARVIRSEYSLVVRMSSLALYKGELVIVKQLNGSSIDISRDLLIELKGLRELSNENLARLVGLCLDPEHLSIVHEYCSRGNLQDLLLNTSISMDWNLKYSIIGDILNGLNFIHTTLLDYHGRLKSTNLVLDSRFTVKLTDFGLKSLYSQLELIETSDNDDHSIGDTGGHPSRLQPADASANVATGGVDSTSNDAASDTLRRQSMAPTIYNMDSVSMRAENFASHSGGMGGGGASGGLLGSSFHLFGGAHGSQVDSDSHTHMHMKNRGSARFLWTAPEHLRQRQPHLAGSKRGDIYSLAIILYEIFTRKQPYYFGTNAKPRWQIIKREKLRFQRQQARDQQTPGHQHVLMAGSHVDEHATSFVSRKRASSRRSGVASASTGSGASGTQSGPGLKSSSILGRNRKRRSNASVSPMNAQQVAAVTVAEVAETESCASHSSSSSVHKDGKSASRLIGGQSEQVKISVSAFSSSIDRTAVNETIGEELEREEDDEAAVAGTGDGASSIVSHPQASHDSGRRRKASAASQDFKCGSSRLKSKTTDGDASASGALDAEEILDQLRMGVQPEPVRPYIPNYLLHDIDPRMMSLLRSCWHEQPSVRPTAVHVRNTMRKITKGATAKNYLDNLLDRLQTYASQLEMIVDSKSADIMAEKARTEELLYQLVPRFVADKLKRSEPIIPQVFEGVTIFFSDIVGFEKYASIMSPCELVDLLNSIYSSFESIISSFDVTKIEVILDQFLVASGISLQQQQEHHGIDQPADTNKDQEDHHPQQQQQQQRSTDGEAPAKPTRSKRRILGGLRGSQSIDEKGTTGQAKKSAKDNQQQQQQQQQQQNESNAEAEGQAADMSHYKRSSAEQIARMALCIRDLVKSFHFRQNLNSIQSSSAQQQQQQDESGTATGAPQRTPASFVATTFNIRIGIHSGKVCAGIVGVKRPKFCLIGDTVNVASRMHTNSKANRIQISSSTRDLLKQVPGFVVEPRGRIEIKGKGMMETFWLESSY